MSPEPGQALVLTAGLATRLRPLSLVRAKAALPVSGEPLVSRLLHRLATAGIRSAVLNLHHRPETIAAVIGDGADAGITVRYSWEHPLLGSAGGPRKALPLLEATRFLVVNGDTLTNVDLSAVRRAHVESGARVTMALIPTPEPTRYGGVRVDADGWVRGFSPRSSAAGSEDSATYHFIGVQVVDSDVFAGLEEGQFAESVSGLYPLLIARNPRSIKAFISPADFHDIGTPGDYLTTSLGLALAEGRGELLPLGARADVHPTARLVRSAVWDDVTVERDVELNECIVTDGVRVPAGTRLSRTILRRMNGGSAEPGERALGDLLLAPFEISGSRRGESPG